MQSSLLTYGFGGEQRSRVLTISREVFIQGWVVLGLVGDGLAQSLFMLR